MSEPATRPSHDETPLPRLTPAQRLGMWSYRLWLLLATGLLVVALLYLQSLVGAIPAHPTTMQRGVQWAELVWLAPAPLALALWLGWFLFAETARPRPPTLSPPLHPRTGQPVRLVFRYVTRGDNQDVLRDAVASVRLALDSYETPAGPWRIEVVTERAVTLDEMAGSLRQFVVPKTYRTPEGSRFKARALTYLQTHTAPEPEDWHLYLDEESQIDSTLIAGLYRLVRQSYRQAERARLSTPRVVGQGGILYAGGSWFFRGADALRTADDIGRFRLQYALGMPLFGIHGSYIVVAGEDDPQLSFDVGPASSLTEDAAWALRTWARGYRFTWVEGYIYEQPPQRVMDFIRQRARWLSGIRLVLRDARVPMRYRASLAIFTALWQISFIPFVVTLAALVVHIAPPVWMRIPADFGWATFVLAYLQGAHVEARHAARAHIARAAASGKPLLWWQRVAVWVGLRLLAWLSSLCYIWYALLEAAGVLYSLLPKRDFFVIYKPSLAGSPSPSPHEAPKQPAPLARRPSA